MCKKLLCQIHILQNVEKVLFKKIFMSHSQFDKKPDAVGLAADQSFNPEASVFDELGMRK